MKPHIVLFTSTEDVECAVRAMFGQSTKAIMAETGFSPGQISYRVKKAGISRQDFRDGKTDLARRMIQIGRRHAVQTVRTEIAPKFRRLG